MDLATIDEAVAIIAQGGMVIAVDDERRENEGDLVMAAEHATAEALAFIVRHCCGIVCAPMSDHIARALELPLMVARNTESMRTAFTVSVDLSEGITTGVSATERAMTLRALADPRTQGRELARPGHIFPLIAHPGGVAARAGHTEAAVDLVTLAGLSPVGVICEVVNADGSMARRPDLDAFAARHGLCIVSIADLVEHKEHLGLNRPHLRSVEAA